MDLEAVGRAKRGRIDSGAGDDDHPQGGHQPLGFGIGGDDAAQEVPADSRPADGDDAHLLVGPVPELGAQRSATGQPRGVEASDVPGEVEVFPGPVPDAGQVGTEVVGHDIVGVADEDRPVPHPRIAGDVLDYLRVVVGRQPHAPPRRERLLRLVPARCLGHRCLGYLARPSWSFVLGIRLIHSGVKRVTDRITR